MSSHLETTGRSAWIAVGLSALAEGLGQAYNRQPAKATGLLAAGLTLSTASGLNTWLARNVFRLKRTRIGPEQIHAGLLTAWAITYTLNLVDAWAGSRRSQT